MRVVEHQMWNHRLHPDVDTPRASRGGLLERRLTRRVHDVDVGARQLGERTKMIDSGSLYRTGPRRLVPFRPGLPIRKQSSLHRIDRLGVLAVGGHDDP